MSLFDVQHQPSAQTVVQQSLRAGRLAHGLLLVGPAGVGKEMFATRLAQVLLCPQPITTKAGLDSCGRCDSCHLAGAGTHPDLHLIYRELSRLITELKNRQGLELYIQVIRQYVLDPSATKSSRGHGKAFVIRDAHLMNDEAQNALLKTLEEPPPDSYLMLVTDQADKLLPTIRSRCQLVRFAPLPVDFVRDQLAGRPVEARKIAPDEAAYLAARTGGQLGVALQMAQADLFGLHQELAGRLEALTPLGAIDLADWLEQQVTTLARERVEREGITDSQGKKEVACELLSTAALIIRDALRLLSGIESAVAPALFPSASARLAGSPAPPPSGPSSSGGPPHAGDRLAVSREVPPGKQSDLAIEQRDERLLRLAKAIDAISRADYLIGVRFVNPRLALDELTLTLAAALAEPA